MPIIIERVRSRSGGTEEPVLTARGYQLAGPRLADGRNLVENATFVETLEEAADLLEQGYSIWMTRPGLRPSLISPKSLRVTR